MEEAKTHLIVVNWNQFLQYKDGRRPSWIKIDCGLLDNYGYAKLSDTARGQLLGIQMLAASTAGKIPNDPAWIAERIQTKSELEIDSLISNGFLQYAASTTSVQTPYAAPEPSVPREREYREQRDQREEPPMPTAGNPKIHDLIERLQVVNITYRGGRNQFIEKDCPSVARKYPSTVVAGFEKFLQSKEGKPNASPSEFASNADYWCKEKAVTSRMTPDELMRRAVEEQQ